MILKAIYTKSSLLQGCVSCSLRRSMSSNTGAVNLSYYSYEKKVPDSYERQPLVILHGMMGSKQNWQSLAKVFGKTGRKVIALDARNHGESMHTEEMDYMLFRDDVLRLMDEQELEQAVLIGHSMGGKTAMTTALTNPERVSGLVIVDVSPAISPNVNKTPAYLEAMLKISLTFLDEDSPQLSKIRRQIVNELAEAVQSSNTYIVAAITDETMILKAIYTKSSLLQGCVSCSLRRSMSSNTGAVSLSYYSYEKKVPDSYERQPLVILHGMMGSKQNWQSLAKVFGKTGRKVIALDARNHGESMHTEEMDYMLFRDDVLRLMDEQELEQAVLIGHSMGGKTAMTTALTNPERVSGLVIVDVSPAISPNVNKTPAYLEAMLKISLTFLDEDSPQLSKIRRQIVNELAEAVQDEPMRHFLASNLAIKDNKVVWRCNLDSIINNFNALASFPKFEDEQYYGQTLFLGGMRSNYIHIEHYPKIKSLFPTAEIKHIPDAGHWVHADKPEQFVKLVNEFLNDSEL